jgi:hypothetical protein
MQQGLTGRIIVDCDLARDPGGHDHKAATYGNGFKMSSQIFAKEMLENGESFSATG